MKSKIITGDALTILKTLPSESVDAVVTDPPYGIGFMGKEWDTFSPENIAKGVARSSRKDGEKKAQQFDVIKRKASLDISSAAFESARYDLSILGQVRFQEWTTAWAHHAFRVLKPGGHLLCFASTRTYHRMASGVEDAGFEIRDQIGWAFGSGFPKSHNLHGEWEGWGTALKPAWEPIVLARKPFRGTVEKNVGKHGTGALNIDGCRVGTEKIQVHDAPAGSFAGGEPGRGSDTESYREHTGRWPANLIHDGSDEAVRLFPAQAGAGGRASGPTRGKLGTQGRYGKASGENMGESAFYGDSGSAARFFYCAKVSKAERNFGCEQLESKLLARSGGSQGAEERGEAYEEAQSIGLNRQIVAKNNHPTVKPVALMRYLCKLVTPPAGTVLDPFMGSGTTGIAAKLEGFGFVGVEKEPEYVRIAKARIAAWGADPQQTLI